YAKHAVSEYGKAGEAQGAARIQPIASQPVKSLPAAASTKPSSDGAGQRDSKASLQRLTAASRASGEGTATRLKAEALAQKGLLKEAAEQHDEAASAYDIAAIHYKAAGALQYAQAYFKYATQERA